MSPQNDLLTYLPKAVRWDPVWAYLRQHLVVWDIKTFANPWSMEYGWYFFIFLLAQWSSSFVPIQVFCSLLYLELFLFFFICTCLCYNLDTNPLSVISVPSIFSKCNQVYNLFFPFYLRALWMNNSHFIKQNLSIFLVRMYLIMLKITSLCKA